jgi:hypothetical protein
MPCCHGDALAGAVLSSTELPEKQVGKCSCGRLYGLSADKERIRFHRAEIPVRQHPHELPGIELCARCFPLDAAIPSPATALTVAPSLIVIASWVSTRTEVTRPSLRNEREHGHGDYEGHRSRPPLRKRRLVLRLPRGTSRYLGPPTIPNDYSSTTTIPKLNFRFPERTVTMQETYADRCREGHRWGEN